MDWLKGLREEWNSAQERLPSMRKVGPQIPNGTHKAVIISGDVDPDRPMIKFGLRFPDFKNIVRTKVIFVSGKLEYVLRELDTIGANTLDPETLEAAVKSSVGKVVEVYVNQKEGEKYAKMYFNKDLGERVELEAASSDDAPENWG
jgi:hypothetical protein